MRKVGRRVEYLLIILIFIYLMVRFDQKPGRRQTAATLISDQI